MSSIDPAHLAAARQQIASGAVDTFIADAAKELAETHAEVFVQRMVSYKDNPAEVVSFTMAYFQALKEAIDTAIMANSELE